MKRIIAFFISFIVIVLSIFLISCDEQNEIKSISLFKLGKTEYYVGEELDPTGFAFQAEYSKGANKDIDLTLDMCDKKVFDKAGDTEITVTYEGVKTSFTVTVLEKPDTTKMEVKVEGEKNYSSETPLDLSGYLFLITFASGDTLEVQGSDEKISADVTTFTESDDSYEQNIKVTYRDGDIKVSTVIKVNVLSEWDYEDYIEEKEIDELISKVEEDCDKLFAGKKITDDIKLPRTEDYNFKLKLSWNSSNEKVISLSGIVNPREEDETVNLSVEIYKIGSSTLIKKLDYEVVVPGLGPVDFPSLEDKKVVMAYFYEGNFREMPKSDGNKIDILCYCFGRVDNGKLTISGLGKINTVMKWRREYKMRILLSIGGGASEGFSGAVKDEASRKKFVDSIMDVVKEYGFDGIDIDWEYPGWSGLSDSTAYDKQNNSLFLRDLRAALDEYKEGLLLTYAVISSSADKFYEPRELNKYLDYVNIMTYDGNIGNYATHHTAPYGAGYSTDNAIKLWINGGVDPKKIIIGAAFYGKISELKNPVSNPQYALGHEIKSISTITYTRIYNEYLNNTSFKECYDSVCGAYFLSDGKYFITYDNYNSILSKAELIKKYNLAGMMFWDYGSDSTGQLLQAVYVGVSDIK